MKQQKSLNLKGLITGIYSIIAISFCFNLAGADEIAKGKTLYATCTACHMHKGEGNPVLKAPAIAGQEKWYTINQLKAFKARKRGAHPKDIEGKMMQPMSMVLADDKAISAVAAYINSLKPVKTKAVVQGGNKDNGKKIYTEITKPGACITCHGPTANGNPALKAPALTILPDWYLLSSLKKFHGGVRGGTNSTPEAIMMKGMLTTSQVKTEQDMKDVIAYITSLRDAKKEAK